MRALKGVVPVRRAWSGQRQGRGERYMELGVALGVATLGTVGTAIFRAAGVGATLEETALRHLPPTEATPPAELQDAVTAGRPGA
ncbi:hypothetical protein [Nonomuraea dietziae]|uniref:hypothetical protein n=1 Tax=Nonomuraea dietziae TaxID=65515 RepID=UPI0034016794